MVNLLKPLGHHASMNELLILCLSYLLKSTLNDNNILGKINLYRFGHVSNYDTLTHKLVDTKKKKMYKTHKVLTCQSRRQHTYFYNVT